MTRVFIRRSTSQYYLSISAIRTLTKRIEDVLVIAEQRGALSFTDLHMLKKSVAVLKKSYEKAKSCIKHNTKDPDDPIVCLAIRLGILENRFVTLAKRHNM